MSKNKPSLAGQVVTLERRVMCEMLDLTNGNVKAAAKNLQMPLRTMWHKIKRYGIRPDDYRLAGNGG